MSAQRARCYRFVATLVALGFVGSTTSAFAATYYVDAAAASDSGNGSSSSPKKYISSALALMSSSGGDAVIIRPGTYSNAKDAITSVPSGKQGSYNVIKAETDGTVTIKAAFELGRGDHYTQFEGLKWDSAQQKSIVGRYVKVMRCAFKGGPSSGNAMTLSIGTNDATPGAQYILLEDVWAYGPGGRYKVIVYNSDSVVLRRVVVRHDAGWTYDNNNPQGGITSYNSSNVRLQDVIVIDGTRGMAGMEGNIYLVGNDSSATMPTNVRIQGAIVLNGGGNGISYDDFKAYTNSSIQDAVVWKVDGAGITIGGAAHKATVNRVAVSSGSSAFADYSSGGNGMTITNAIAYQNPSAVLKNLSNASYIVGYGNGDSTGTQLNPLTNGFKYLPRIENGSTLKTMGSGGGQIGPQITQRIGVSGTLFGEAGFEDETAQPLWPWPNEARIKTDFAEYNSRGFSASAGSLTDYIWDFLGSSSPVSPAITPNAPTSVQVQ
ncbi:MAG TPA: hypothetical protein VFS24_15635 [Steroidobacteraceae bacterium]|nr:hypothetical protein [Steroidobacteraceae bacterium]